MWLVASCWLYSITEKPWDRQSGTLTIRSWVGADLDALQEHYLSDLTATSEDPNADYRFRATAPRASVKKAMAAMVRDIDYGNAKDEFFRVHGDQRAVVYRGVWAALARLQRRCRPAVDPTYGSIGRNRADDEDRPLHHDPSKGST